MVPIIILSLFIMLYGCVIYLCLKFSTINVVFQVFRSLQLGCYLLPRACGEICSCFCGGKYVDL